MLYCVMSIFFCQKRINRAKQSSLDNLIWEFVEGDLNISLCIFIYKYMSDWGVNIIYSHHSFRNITKYLSLFKFFCQNALGQRISTNKILIRVVSNSQADPSMPRDIFGCWFPPDFTKKLESFFFVCGKSWNLVFSTLLPCENLYFTW